MHLRNPSQQNPSFEFLRPVQSFFFESLTDLFRWTLLMCSWMESSMLR